MRDLFEDTAAFAAVMCFVGAALLVLAGIVT